MPERSYASPLERLARAVIEAQVLCNVFGQLAVEADPKLSWRAELMSRDLRLAIDTFMS